MRNEARRSSGGSSGGMSVTPELEPLLSADEEGRVRIEAARASARARLDSLAQDLDHEHARKRKERERTLEEEISAIRAGADREVARRTESRAAYREERHRRAEVLLPQAAGVFAAILRDGPSGRKP
jgi:hypothetical protein